MTREKKSEHTRTCLRRKPALVAILMIGSLLLTADYHYAQKDLDDIEENHHEFEVYASNEPYQFSPVDADGYTLIKGLIGYPYEKETGLVAWKLTIYNSRNKVVKSFTDKALLQPNRSIRIERKWDGRDKKGKVVRDGKYHYLLVAHFVPQTDKMDKGTFETIPALFKNHETYGAKGTVIVNSKPDKSSLKKQGSGEFVLHRAQPIEPGFPYNFYYGNFHSQSNFSDGGLDLENCRPNLLCRTGLSPDQAYSFARDVARLDFLGITDHNHQFDCSDYYREGVPTCRADPADVLWKYQAGLAAAQAATEENAFVAVYGVEFGINSSIREPTAGHVGVLEAPGLFNWEEHETGSCYDVFVGRSDYAGLYAAAVQNPPDPWGPMLVLNHPRTISEFNNFAFDANALDAVVGIEVVNGPAFSTATDQSGFGTHYDGDNVFCPDKCQPECNVRCAFSSHKYMWALSRGFHVAPFASQDNHCNNFGISTANRTVILAPSLTKDDLMTAVRQRHVYATSKDNNVQLIFSANDNTYIMGDQFVNSGPIRFHVSVNDPDPGETVSEIRVYAGTSGSRRPPGVIARSTSSPFDFTFTLTPGERYVFVYAVQADGSEVWSAPMWITQR